VPKKSFNKKRPGEREKKGSFPSAIEGKGQYRGTELGGKRTKKKKRFVRRRPSRGRFLNNTGSASESKSLTSSGIEREWGSVPEEKKAVGW